MARHWVLMLNVSMIMTIIVISTPALGYYRKCYEQPSVCFTAETKRLVEGKQTSLLQTLSSSRSWCTKNSASLVKIKDENVQRAIMKFIQDNSSQINTDIILDASSLVTLHWHWINGNAASLDVLDGAAFDGSGYIILPKERFNPTRMILVQFSFTTFANEGLMFYTGTPGKDFLSVEIRDGKVVYQYDLGFGPAVLMSTRRYNDGRLHVVSANRVDQNAILKIDHNTVASARLPHILINFDIGNDFLYFGGFNGTLTHNATITDKKFKGCIKDIQVGSSNRTIIKSNNLHDEDEIRPTGYPQFWRKKRASVLPTRIKWDDKISHYGYWTRENAGQIGFESDMAFTKRKFICYSDSQDCYKGIMLNGRCYRVYNESLTWFDARSRCLTENSDLAIFEPNFNCLPISQMLEGGEYWIGLARVIWSWGYGEKINYYNWEVGQPNPSDGECLCLNRNSGKWKTCPCDRSYRFVCIEADDLENKTCASVMNSTVLIAVLVTIGVLIFVIAVLAIVVDSVLKKSSRMKKKRTQMRSHVGTNTPVSWE